MLSQSNLFITNGQSLGDAFGEYTSINYNGASTVDYFLLSKTNLIIRPLTSYSDHKPLSLILNLNSDHLFTHSSGTHHRNLQYEEARKPYKWKPEALATL